MRWEGRRGRLEIQPIEGTQPADTEKSKDIYEATHPQRRSDRGWAGEDKQAAAPELATR